MNAKNFPLVVLLVLTAQVFAGVSVDEEKLGKSLGGWKERDGKAAEYPLSGANYRTYRPEVTPTPDGGDFYLHPDRPCPRMALLG